MYGEIYFHSYCINDTGDTARVSIRKRDYTGSALEVKAGPVPFTKSLLNNEDDLIGGIYPTMASIQLIGDQNFGMSDIMTANDSDFQIVHLINGQVDWIGFLTPESFGELDTNNYRYLDINAFDGLTRLKDLKFIDDYGQNYGVSDVSFEKTFLFAIKECLKKTGLELDILTLVDRLPVTITNNKSKYNVNSLNDGWVFSTGFNILSEDLVKVGNYISYSITGRDGDFTSLITQIDRSDVPDGGGTGILLSPNMATGLDLGIEAYFFAPIADSSKDVLAVSFHDTRIWIDPGNVIDIELKSEQDKPYYEFTQGTVSSWDVLQSIAEWADCKVSQENGKWIFQALDSHRISDQFFRYGFDGGFIDRVAKLATSNIPCEPSKIKHKQDGNTRYIDKTLKSVSVGYNYRYKVAGDKDSLVNIISNGKFVSPMISSDPANVFTPEDWTREVVKDPITFNIYRPLLDPHFDRTIEITTPNEFNSYNRLQPQQFDVFQGDELILSWNQSIREFFQGIDGETMRYNTVIIELITGTGFYYLVNHEEEKGWTNTEYMSKNPTGQWVKKDGFVWHFNTNYATSHSTNINPSGEMTPLSRVNIKTLAVPESGKIKISFVGVSRKMQRFGSSGSDMYDWRKYARAYIASGYNLSERAVSYREWAENDTWLLTFYKGNYNDKVVISDVSITKIANEQKGKGRLYEYKQDGDYFDTINDVNLFIGDENNPDHLSVVKVDGRVQDKWITRDNSLGVQPSGLLLAKSILRRYYRPKMMLDGGLSTYPLRLSEIITFEDTPLVEWGIKSGDIHSKEHVFTGTLFQNLKLDIPNGGIDYGPNSLGQGSNKGSSLNGGGGSSGSGGSGGASQSWVLAQNFLKASDADFQKTTERGASTSVFVSLNGGAEINGNLYIPSSAPIAVPEGKNAAWQNDGYLLFNGQKVKAGVADFSELANHANTASTANYATTAGHANTADYALDSDKWDGRQFADYLDQPVRVNDDVRHKSVSSPTYTSGATGHGFKINADGSAEFDSVSIRKELNVVQLNVREITGTGGSFAVTNVAKISHVVDAGTYYQCWINTDDGTIFVPFVAGDIIRCQVWDGKGVKYYTVKLVNVTAEYFEFYKADMIGGGIPSAGDAVFQWGSQHDINRQGLIYMTNSDTGAPYLDVLDGINSADLAGKTKVRLGKLNGITDAVFGALNGYGLYSQNAYLRGNFWVTGGNAETLDGATNKANEAYTNAVNSAASDASSKMNNAITSANQFTQNAVDAIQVGGRNFMWNSGNFKTTQYWDYHGASYEVSSEVTYNGKNTLKIWGSSAGIVNSIVMRVKQDHDITVTANIYSTVDFNGDANSNNAVIHVQCWTGETGETDVHQEQIYEANSQLLANKWNVVYKKFKTPASSSDVYIRIYFYTIPSDPIYIGNIKLEEGNKATSWTPAPEDQQNALEVYKTEVSQSFSVMNGEIAGKVNQTDFNALGQVVNNQGTAITANTTAIEQRATKTQFDSLTNTVGGIEGRVTTAEGAIVTQAGQIALTASKTEVTTAINNIQVGGRNYYTKNTPINEYDGAYGLIKTDTGFSVIGVVANTGTVRLQAVITANGWWTVSFEHRIDYGGYPLSVDICDNATFITPTQDGEWRKTVVTTNIQNWSDTLYHFVDIGMLTGQRHYFRNVKIEKGNKATDWTPSSEDVVNESKIYTNSQIDLVNDSITSTSTRIDSLSGRMDNAEFKLQPTQIDAVVSSLDYKTGAQVAAGFQVTSGGMNVFGQFHSFNGAVTFNSLDSSTQGSINTANSNASSALANAATANTAAGNAQSAADSAQGTANTAVTNAANAQSSANTANSNLSALQGSLGSLAYDNAVTLAKLDSTIVIGGYIKTNLINATEVFAQNITATGLITALNLNVTGSSKIGEMSINNDGYMYNNAGNGGLLVTGGGIIASVGPKASPETLGVSVAGWFSNNKSGSQANHALVVEAKNSSTYNDAITVLNGDITLITGNLRYNANAQNKIVYAVGSTTATATGLTDFLILKNEKTNSFGTSLGSYVAVRIMKGIVVEVSYSNSNSKPAGW